MTKLSKAEWLEERRKGIGGSDMPAILGVDKYRSPYDVYLDKIGRGPVIEVTKPMQRGTAMQPIISDIYAETTNRELMQYESIRKHEKIPYLLANVDGVIFADRGEGILEIKCPGLHVFGQCQREGLPKSYIIQLNHYLNVWGLHWGSIAVFNAEKWELIHFDVERDDELIEMMEERGKWFWMKVVKREPPEDLVVDAVDVKMPEYSGEVVQVESHPTVKDLWHKYTKDLIMAKALKEEVAEIEKTAKERIQKLMTGVDADVCESDGVRVYWREQAGRKTLDKKAMVADGIDVKKYEKQGKPFKVFRFYNLKPQIEFI